MMVLKRKRTKYKRNKDIKLFINKIKLKRLKLFKSVSNFVNFVDPYGTVSVTVSSPVSVLSRSLSIEQF